MAKDATPAKLAELKQIQLAPPGSATADQLRPYLRDRSNSVVAKAASLAPEIGGAVLIPDLLTAFERLMRDPVKNDPQCTGKIAVLKALRDLDCDEPAVLFRAARHIQWEPVWGGSVDTAVEVRAVAGHALTSCHGAAIHDIYMTLVDLMADPEPRVRAEAALAVGRFEHAQSELLLRLKIRSGDEAVEVMGACFDGLLGAAPERAVGLIAPFLDRDEDLAFEAASALGASRVAEAFDFVLARIAEGHRRSDTLLRCLAPKKTYPEMRARIASAVEAHGGEALRRVFEREFPALD